MSTTIDDADGSGTLMPAFIADGVALTLAEGHANGRPVAPYGTVAVALDGRRARIAAAHHESGAAPVEASMQALLARLDPPSRLRLLRFLLGFCRSAFQLGGTPVFAETCRRLVAETLPEPAVAIPVARLTEGTMLVRGLLAPAGAALHVLRQDQVFCSTMPGCGDAAAAIGGINQEAAVQAIEAVQPGDIIVADCRAPPARAAAAA